MNWLSKVTRKRLLQHITFWSISFYILLNNFQTTSQIAPVDIIYTGIFITFLMTASYINLFVLVPVFFKKGRYVVYVISMIVLLLSSNWLYIFGFDLIVDVVFEGYYLISYFDFWDTAKYFVIFLSITSLLHFSKSWFLYQESETKLTKIQKEKLTAELDALKSQINPHFLFNSLNSIYSLVLKKSDHAPEALIKLSDSMRYIIYESNHEKVPLVQEIDFLRNYIELQRLRTSAKDKLSFEVSGEIAEQKIAPLLMIPIIENCFKYGIKGETEQSFVSVDIDASKNHLTLKTINNRGSVDHVESKEHAGTGLKNLRKRLELIYPDQHLLKIEERDDKFIVELKIDL